MRVRIDRDELYPVYDFYSGGKEFDVPDEVAARWTRAMNLFDEAQREMASYYRGE